MQFISVFKLVSSVRTIDLMSLLSALFASIVEVFANSDSTAVVFALTGA